MLFFFPGVRNGHASSGRTGFHIWESILCLAMADVAIHVLRVSILSTESAEVDRQNSWPGHIAMAISQVFTPPFGLPSITLLLHFCFAFDEHALPRRVR